MASGLPLNDEDRKDWLVNLNKQAKKHSELKGAVIACSALKEAYREILQENIEKHVKWVFLKGDMDLIKSRIESRSNHFMPSNLLQSQFDTLETPEYGLHLDISEKPEILINTIIKEFNL